MNLAHPDLATIKKAAIGLLTYRIVTPEKEGEKTILSFYLSDFTEEIGKRGAKVVVPATISKIAVNKILEKVLVKTDREDASSLDEKMEAVAEVSGPHLVNYMDKAISGFGSYLASRPEFESPEQRQTACRFLLSAMASVIAENEKAASVADPFLDCKRRFASSDTYEKLLASANPSVLVIRNIQDQINELEKLKMKAEEVSATDYLAFIKEKKAANGLQEDKESPKYGFVLLRGKKDEKKSTTTEEKVEEKAEAEAEEENE
jgi:hypothetical protein